MKKNMIALAVAGALVAPVAMAEVTVSGGLQAELVQIGGDGSARNGLYAADAWEAGKESAGNYGFLKFSASEDLGGGMKALAMYNMNANVGDSSKAGFDTRDAYVGLSTGLGTILAGTLSTPYKSSTVGWDPMLMTSFQARGSNGMSILHNSYASNAVAYANSFAGGMVSVVAAVVLDESNDATDAEKTTAKHAKSFSVNVKPMSGLDIALAYIDVTDFGDLNTLGLGLPAGLVSTDDANATKIGVKYSMGSFTVAAQHEMINKGLTATGDKGSVSYVTGSFKINDANTISASYGRSSKEVGTLGTAGTATAPLLAASFGDDAATYMAVAFNHAFSKNTSAFVGYRVSDSGSVTTATLDYTDPLATPLVTGTNVDTKESAIGAGLRVNF